MHQKFWVDAWKLTGDYFWVPRVINELLLVWTAISYTHQTSRLEKWYQQFNSRCGPTPPKFNAIGIQMKKLWAQHGFGLDSFAGNVSIGINANAG